MQTLPIKRFSSNLPSYIALAMAMSGAAVVILSASWMIEQQGTPGGGIPKAAGEITSMLGLVLAAAWHLIAILISLFNLLLPLASRRLIYIALASNLIPILYLAYFAYLR